MKQAEDSTLITRADTHAASRIVTIVIDNLNQVPTEVSAISDVLNDDALHEAIELEVANSRALSTFEHKAYVIIRGMIILTFCAVAAMLAAAVVVRWVL